VRIGLASRLKGEIGLRRCEEILVPRARDQEDDMLNLADLAPGLNLGLCVRQGEYTSKFHKAEAIQSQYYTRFATSANPIHFRSARLKALKAFVGESCLSRNQLVAIDKGKR
jgi:hypothetical protein